MQPAVLLMMRYWPLPMLSGARFQKPSERLLIKHAACSAVTAQIRSTGTMMESLQLSQNLFLKLCLPGTNRGMHVAPPWSCAPQQLTHAGAAPNDAVLSYDRLDDCIRRVVRLELLLLGLGLGWGWGWTRAVCVRPCVQCVRGVHAVRMQWTRVRYIHTTASWTHPG